jgi:hypothetical protein
VDRPARFSRAIQTDRLVRLTKFGSWIRRTMRVFPRPTLSHPGLPSSGVEGTQRQPPAPNHRLPSPPPPHAAPPSTLIWVAVAVAPTCDGMLLPMNHVLLPPYCAITTRACKMARSNNDINMLQPSPVFDRL